MEMAQVGDKRGHEDIQHHDAAANLEGQMDDVKNNMDGGHSHKEARFGDRGRGSPYRGRGRGGRGRGRDRDFKYEPKYDQEMVMQGDGGLEIRVSLKVKREWAGAIIGRGGENVKQVRRESRCQVHINAIAKGMLYQTVQLCGPLDRVLEAHQKIHGILLSCEDLEYQDQEEKEARVELLIFPEMVGCLIGKSGQHVRWINKNTGAMVKVQNLKDGQNQQLVQIYGGGNACAEAFKHCIEYLHRFDPKKSGMLRSTGGHMNNMGNMPPMPAGDPHKQPPINNMQAPPPGQPLPGQTIIMQPQQQPQILVMQPNGTLAPAQIMFENGQQVIATGLGQQAIMQVAPQTQMPQTIMQVPQTVQYQQQAAVAQAPAPAPAPQNQSQGVQILQPQQQLALAQPQQQPLQNQNQPQQYAVAQNTVPAPAPTGQVQYTQQQGIPIQGQVPQGISQAPHQQYAIQSQQQAQGGQLQPQGTNQQQAIQQQPGQQQYANGVVHNSTYAVLTPPGSG